jgi:peptide/nickel transport system permease protein
MGRFRFIGHRAIHIVPVVLIVLLATFALLKLVPGDPARAVAGPRASDEAVSRVRARLGLDQPVWVQFARYVNRVAHGELGRSANGNVAVTRLISENSPVTLWLIVGGTLMAAIMTVPMALLAARRVDQWPDRVVRGVSIFGLTVPPFWVGTMLLTFVAVRTGWFPVGRWPTGFFERAHTMVLPSVTLGLALTPVLVRSLRTSMLDVLQSDFVVAARAAGVEGWALTRRFVLRNSAVPALSLLATSIAYLLFGTVLVETTFGLPGLGQTMVQSAVNRDFNVVQGLTLVFAFVVVVVNLLGDISLAAVDPRIRVGS